ncbi:MAG: site-specific DNA-methyltransferase, partial [Eubacteriales bacterium]
MAAEKAIRNKTIDTSLSEGKVFLDRCITVTQKQSDLHLVMDKTIVGDMLEVCSLLPDKSVDLMIVDPP